jgi:histidine triad (HIT) family protein
MKYDDENIFAKILRNEIPSEKIYEDERVFVFMDIMPRSPGHLLVIPKGKYRNILDVDRQSLQAVIDMVKSMSKLVIKAFGADGILIQQSNEAAGGQEVFHLHFHVIPRYSGVKLTAAYTMVKDLSFLTEQANKIRAHLKSENL